MNTPYAIVAADEDISVKLLVLLSGGGVKLL